MAKIKIKKQICKLIVAEIIGGDSIDGENFENLLDREVLSEETVYEYEDSQLSKIAWLTK